MQRGSQKFTDATEHFWQSQTHHNRPRINVHVKQLRRLMQGQQYREHIGHNRRTTRQRPSRAYQQLHYICVDKTQSTEPESLVQTSTRCADSAHTTEP